ncbi:hypothetical protein A6A04_06840 [Paramagnetospirillum marisnigri]|uniref:sulfate adenylyltransferase n=1 Tax=Paramagnetospirillum marisnigri TaxID=1285242 RepID=A0A178MBS9_9PROT|nr:sulfate adenylyltransferase [Paramagnetospirillum marisnigri]OAN45607.1 hypothetical protein A6A04_06840 [Paramagnetospirillum marisnigri]
MEIALNRDQYLEMEKLGLGAFAPLTGFMTEDQFESVVNRMRLPDGQPFPLPVFLSLDADRAEAIRGLPRVALTYQGEPVGELVPESWFRRDRPRDAAKLFGTTDADHPGVAQFLSDGEVFVGGPVRLLKRARLDISDYELTPEQSRAEFARRGWTTVVGFQTRNVPHRAHEYLLRLGLEVTDGLFVQPLIGRKKAGDYTPAAIIAGYRTLIGGFLPPERVVLGVLSTSMRYAGPREAVFHAIIRRNYGCTHFIVGRDHAGVGSYYGKYEAHEMVARFDGELGITVLRLAGPFHCAICDGIVTERSCAHVDSHPDAISDLSGTRFRAMLLGGETPDAHFVRPAILKALADVPLFEKSE